MAFLLAKAPGNHICADCAATNPRWASVNLGILICIECSGVHRSLGTHISQVRSLSLDQWTQEQLDTCLAIGNRKANAFWEATLPADFPRPNNSNRSALEAFIRAKYVDKKWVASALPAAPSVATASAASLTGRVDDPFAEAFAAVPAAAAVARQPKVDLLEDFWTPKTTVAQGLEAIDEALANAPPVKTDALTAAMQRNLDIFR